MNMKNEDYEELIGQIESVKENLKADLDDLDEVLDGCVFLGYDELMSLIEENPNEYRRIIRNIA